MAVARLIGLTGTERIVSANRATAKLTGVLCKAIIGRTLMQEQSDCYECAFASAAFRDIERLLTSLHGEV